MSAALLATLLTLAPTQVAVLTPSDLQKRFDRYFPGKQVSSQARNVRVYKLRYPSQNPLTGRTESLSGLVALPEGGAPRGMVVFYHGTIVTSVTAPSRWTAATESTEPDIALAAFTEAGFAVAMPDYIGLGDSKGVHPYPLGRVNARSGIDMIGATRAFANARDLPIADALFVSGYSEGGAVAAWAARILQRQQNANYDLHMTAALSGPYDLTNTTLKSVLSEQSNPLYAAVRISLASYLGYSLSKNIPGVDLGDIFVPSFASYVPVAFQRAKNDDEYTKMVVGKGLQLGAIRSIRRLVQPEFRKAAEAKDLSNPAIRALADNDAYDWKPTRPLLMVYLRNDYIVDPKNSKVALEAMRARGAGEDVVQTREIVNDKLNHITAAAPATWIARETFIEGRL